MEEDMQRRGGSKVSSSKRSSMACTSCRQVKLRCDATKCFPAPCTRCQKQRMCCKFDPKFKRTPMRGSLEKMMEENERLRRLVNDSGVTPTESDSSATLPPSSVLLHPSGIEEPLFPDGFTWQVPASQELEEVQLDGLAIRGLFEYFSRHYFRHLPILDLRKPIDSLKSESPLLFWTIIVLAASKHPLHSAHSASLQASLKRILSEYLTRSIRCIWTIQALLLLCLWPFPVATQLDDPSWEYCGTAVAAALKMGLDGSPVHWGEAIQPTTDELTSRLKTWLGCFTVSTNLAACLSLPPPMGSVAHLMPPIRNRIKISLPDEFLARLEIQAYSTRAASMLNSQASHPAQRSFIEILDSDLDATEARMPCPISRSLQVGFLAARLRLYSVPLLFRASPRVSENNSDIFSKAIWYKGFHIAIQLATAFEEWIRPGRRDGVESTDESVKVHFPKYYFHALVTAGMYFINLLVIDTNISTPDKLLARNHIKKVFEMLMAQSTEDRDEASRAAEAIDFLSRHIESQSASLDLRESMDGKRPFNVIGSGMKMAGHARNKLRGSEQPNISKISPAGAPELPALQDLAELPLWGDDLFEWNSWLAGMDNSTTMFQVPATTP